MPNFKTIPLDAIMRARKAAATRKAFSVIPASRFRISKMAMDINPQNKGKLHEKLGVPKKKKLSVAALEKAKQSSSPAERKEATFALNARKWNHSKAAGTFTEALKSEASTLPGDIVGGGLGVAAGKLLTSKNDTPAQKHRNEMIGGVVGAKAGSIGGLMALHSYQSGGAVKTLAEKALSKVASFPQALKGALSFTGQNLIVSGAGGIIGQEIANDTASPEVLDDPKRGSRRAAVGALLGTAGTGFGVSLAHELKRAKVR